MLSIHFIHQQFMVFILNRTLLPTIILLLLESLFTLLDRQYNPFYLGLDTLVVADPATAGDC